MKKLNSLSFDKNDKRIVKRIIAHNVVIYRPL